MVLMSAIMQIKVLATSPDTADLLDTEYAGKLLKAALPEHSDYIEKYGLAAHYPLLDVLEAKLLMGIREMLEGDDFDATAVAKASNIARLISNASVRPSDLKIPSDIELEKPAPAPK